MKKYLYLFLIISSFFAIKPSFAAEVVMAVTEMTGGAQILRGQQEMAVGVGTECQKMDKVKTGPDGQVDVTWNGRLGCRVLPSSDVVLADTNRDTMRIEIRDGNIILNVKSLPKDSTFRVESPSAIATVRGTQFWGRVEKLNSSNPITTFAVREGEVEILVKSSSQIFSLKQGEALDISEDPAAPPLVRPALEEEMKAMEQANSIKTAA